MDEVWSFAFERHTRTNPVNNINFMHYVLTSVLLTIAC